MAFFEIRLVDDDVAYFVIEVPMTQGYVMGRSDGKSDYVPDIDLSELGARDKGVSRRHAVLVRHEDSMHVVDLNSVNGTYLNGRRLPPELPYPVRNGDVVCLGTLELRFVEKARQ
ncbi:MAG: FHA domain-containing protein [Aggregatilineales bacterium]